MFRRAEYSASTVATKASGPARDLFGRPANECAECVYAQLLETYKGSQLFTMVCVRPEVIRANHDAPWFHKIARDECGGKFFVRA